MYLFRSTQTIIVRLLIQTVELYMHVSNLTRGEKKYILTA